MDAAKTGKFIAEIRKELNITQKQLADELGISDKTISKWECGKGMPDIEMITPLCRCLHINVNELLSGERLSEKNYSDYAEGNMISLMKEQKAAKNTKTNIIFKCIRGVIVVAAIWTYMMLGSNYTNLSNLVDGLTITLLIVISIVALLAAGFMKDFINAFYFLFSQNEMENSEELKRALEGVRLERKVLLYSGVFLAVFSSIVLLHNMNDPATIGPSVNVALLSILYGAFGGMLLLPMESKLKGMLMKAGQE